MFIDWQPIQNNQYLVSIATFHCNNGRSNYSNQDNKHKEDVDLHILLNSAEVFIHLTENLLSRLSL